MPREPNEKPRSVIDPESGWFEMRLVRGGPFVAARIEQTPAGLWRAWIDGKAEPPHHDPHLAHQVMHVWLSGRRIDRGRYDWRLATKDWARQHAPEHPCLTPNKPINLAAARSIF